MDDEFNPQLMEIAREARGLTQADLCDLLKVGQGTVSKYENGLLSPPVEFVEKLADKLRYTTAFFTNVYVCLAFPHSIIADARRYRNVWRHA